MSDNRKPITINLNIFFFQKILEFHRKTKSDGSLHSIEVTQGEHTSKHAFWYRDDVVERIGKYVLGKDALDTNERNAIELVFIHATLKQSDRLNILVTSRPIHPFVDTEIYPLITMDEALKVIIAQKKHLEAMKAKK
jgi:hypothetical protein